MKQLHNTKKLKLITSLKWNNKFWSNYIWFKLKSNDFSRKLLYPYQQLHSKARSSNKDPINSHSNQRYTPRNPLILFIFFKCVFLKQLCLYPQLHSKAPQRKTQLILTQIIAQMTPLIQITVKWVKWVFLK